MLNNKGVSLVEVMIALVVLLISFMGFMQVALVSTDASMRNFLRDEAVVIASGTMEEQRSLPFADIVSDTSSIPTGSDCPSSITTGSVINKTYRDIQKDFCVSVECVELGGDADCATEDNNTTKSITVLIGWKWKGEDFTHRIIALRKE